MNSQIKNINYYLFWGACTIAVVAAQNNVGMGYGRMANALERLMDTALIEVEQSFDIGRPDTIYK